MCRWLDFAVDRSDRSIGLNHEGRALRAHVFLTIHAFFDPHSVSFYHFTLLITQEREWELMLGDKLGVALGGVHAHTEHQRPLGKERRVVVSQLTGLHCASGSVVFGIEIKHDGMAAKGGKAHRLTLAEGTADGCEGEIRCWIAGQEFFFHWKNTIPSGEK